MALAKLEELGAPFPEMFLIDLAFTLSDLRQRMLTALVKPLTSEEFPDWIKEFDGIAQSCSRLANGVMRHIRLGLHDPLQPGSGEKKRSIRKIKALAFDQQVDAVVGQFGGDRKMATLAVINEQLFGKKGEDSLPELDTSREETQKYSDQEIGMTSEVRDVLLVERAHDLYDLHLQTTPDAGVATWPVILSKFTYDVGAEKALLAAKIRSDTVFGTYKQIHNCRLLAVPANLLPSEEPYSRRKAEEHFGRLLKRPKYREYIGYFLPLTPMRVRGEHVYYIILPSECKGKISISQWDLGTPPKDRSVAA